MQQEDLAATTILDGRYQIVQECARDEKFVTYRAHHLHIKRDVYIKVLRDKVDCDSERFKQLAKDEGGLAAANGSTSQVRDMGVTASGLAYVVIDCLESSPDLPKALDATAKGSSRRYFVWMAALLGGLCCLCVFVLAIPAARVYSLEGLVTLEQVLLPVPKLRLETLSFLMQESDKAAMYECGAKAAEQVASLIATRSGAESFEADCAYNKAAYFRYKQGQRTRAAYWADKARQSLVPMYNRWKDELKVRRNEDGFVRAALICDQIIATYAFGGTRDYQVQVPAFGCVTSLSRIYAKSGNADKAIALLKRNLDVINSLPNASKGRFLLLFNLGLAYVDAANVPQAVKYEYRALQEAEAEYGFDSIHLVPILTAIANICQVTQQYHQEEALSRRALHILDICMKNRLRDRAELLHHIGLALDRQGKAKEAVNYYRQCWQSYEPPDRGKRPVQWELDLFGEFPLLLDRLGQRKEADDTRRQMQELYPSRARV